MTNPLFSSRGLVSPYRYETTAFRRSFRLFLCFGRLLEREADVAQEAFGFFFILCDRGDGDREAKGIPIPSLVIYPALG